MGLIFTEKEKTADGCMRETPALKARGIVPLPDYEILFIRKISIGCS